MKYLNITCTRWATVTLSVIICTMSWASTVSENMARTIASRFMTGKTWQVAVETSAHHAQSSSRPYYVFNANEGGYVIVAGDDRVPAILGYSRSGTLDPNTAPPALLGLLDSYSQQIDALSSQPQLHQAVSSNLPAIAPLVSCHWNQREPYNQQLPYVDSNQAVTGCVATAMAQIMYYYKWPARPSATIPAYITKTNKIDMPALSPVDFQWELMRDIHLNEESPSSTAVSTLMLYCDQALQMDFLKTSSSASTSAIPSALINYFDYSPSARYVKRASFTTNEWEALLYNELRQSRPVVYRGSKDPGGHSFICDGYDGNGLFHINWGWGSMSDGYYVLSILNPSDQGIGSADGSYGYIFEQGMVIGITPGSNVPSEHIVRFYSMTLDEQKSSRPSTSDNFQVTVCGRYLNCTSAEETFNYGWGLYDGDELLSTVYSGSRTTPLAPNYYIARTCKINFGSGISNGTYTLRPIYSKLGQSDWHWCEGASVNYILVNINGNSCSIIPYGLDTSSNYVIDDVSCTGTFHNGKTVTVIVDATNTGHNTGDMMYLYVDGAKASVALSEIEPGQSGTFTFKFVPQTTGTKTLTFSLNADGSAPIATRTITITAMPAASLKVSHQVLNVTDVTNKVITGKSFSVISQFSNTGQTNYDEEVTIKLYRITSGNSGTLVQTKTLPLQLPAGNSGNVQFDCDNVIDGQKYFAYVYYYSSGGEVKLTPSTYTYTISFPSAGTLQPGDINGDSVVDIQDINLCINIMLGKQQQSQYIGSADVDNNGTVDIQDVNMVINIMLNK